MSDNTNFGFAKLVPGFDFLQNLAKGASQNMPQLSNWVAPTLNVEELDKRIAELKAVHFWLDQNGKALAATIQALEVQKMTLATLQNMNFSMGDLADALKLKTGDKARAAASSAAKAGEAAAAKADDAAGEPKPKAAAKKPAAKTGGEGSAPVDPLQWWGALTQQFQQIAADAMKDVAQKTAADTARTMATGAAKEAMKAATGMARTAAGMARAATPGSSAAPAEPSKKPARKPPARKSRAKTSP